MRMKAKANCEIDVEWSVKGKRGSCPSPFSRELGYIKLGVRACATNMSGDMWKNRGKVFPYTSFPATIVSKVAACTSVQRSKGLSFASRSDERLPRATKSAKRTFERAAFPGDAGV